MVTRSTPSEETRVSPRGVFRSVLVAGTGAALVGLVLAPLARSSWPLAPGVVPRLDDAIFGVLVWAALAIVAWLVMGAVLAALAMLPGAIGQGAARCVQALTPVLLRRALSLLLGTGIGTIGLPLGSAMGDTMAVATQTPLSPAGSGGSSVPGASTGQFGPSPAFAPSTPPAPGGAFADPVELSVAVPSPHFTASPVPPAADTPAPDARWRPTRPTRSLDPDSTTLLAPVPRTADLPDDVVTVRRGDSLWSLAARHLGPGATDRDIARAWPEWYRLNADVIGSDPDLIQPGQQLRIPTLGAHR